jgi:S1-C subfamily serine protease
MSKRVQSLRIVLPLIFLLLAITACSTSARTPEAQNALPTVDTHQIAQAVLAEVESQLAGPAATPMFTVETDEIEQLVIAEVESQLAEKVPPAMPTVDTDKLAESILAQVESRLEQNALTAAPTVDIEQIVETVLAQLESQLVLQSAPALAEHNDLGLALTGGEIENALIGLYQQSNPAVVYIVIPSIGSGSGFVYSSEGHIVTNHHVVEAGRDYEVVFANGERRSAVLIGSDVDSDLAVIKVDQLPDGVQPLPLAEADHIQVGQLVVAIGNPFGEQGSMSLGIISGLGRSLPSQRASSSGGTYSLPQVIQTDAPINPGNSGGPLLNLEGEVVGVNSAIASTTGTNSGVGFSIPVAAVHQVVPSLVQTGEYVYPYMGVSFDSEITLDDQSEFGLPQTQGAYAIDVTPGGPADRAGLRAANRTTGRGGDLIVKIDDQEIKDFATLNSYLVFHTRVGQTIEMTVLRDGELVVLPLALGARP